MKFIATLSHEPEDCWAREENQEKARAWIAEMDQRADEYDIELHGTFVTPNEHTFYIILESGDFGSVTGFLGPPFLEDHDGHIAPVISLERGVAAVFDDQTDDSTVSSENSAVRSDASDEREDDSAVRSEESVARSEGSSTDRER